MKGFNAPSGSAHEDIDFNNYTMRQRARMLYMAAPIATSAIKTNRTNVVGVGLRLKSRIDREVLGLSPDQAERWQKETEREFSLWASNKRACDATGMNNFYGLQQLALISWLLSGDCIGLIKQYETTRLLPYSLRVHLIESDRIATPNNYGAGTTLYYTTGKNPETGNTIYDGVEVDKNGMVVAYHIRSNYPYELGAPVTEWARVLAYQQSTGLPNVLHVIDTERPDQYRGVSYLAQVIEPLLQLRRYTESELMAAVVESFYTAFIKTEGADYTAEYADELLTLSLSGSLVGAETVKIQIGRNMYGRVKIVPICAGGQIPSEDVLADVLAACSADDVRPLTDMVTVEAPETHEYDIELTYYTTKANESEVVQNVEGSGGAIDQYINWQGSTLNQDINPDELRKRILCPDWADDLIGATRVQIIKPEYTELNSTTVAKFSGKKTVKHIVRG